MPTRFNEPMMKQALSLVCAARSSSCSISAQDSYKNRCQELMLLVDPKRQLKELMPRIYAATGRGFSQWDGD